MQPGSGGQPDMSALLAQAQQVQQQLMEAQAALAAAEVNGQAGGGLVQATMKGSGEVIGVPDRPQGRRPDDIETLQDLVIGAIADASKQVTISRTIGSGRWPAGWATWARQDLTCSRDRSRI